jgi:hypothetical protein
MDSGSNAYAHSEQQCEENIDGTCAASLWRCGRREEMNANGTGNIVEGQMTAGQWSETLGLVREDVSRDGPCDCRSSAALTRHLSNSPKLDRFRKQPCTIRTFPLSDPAPQRLSTAIAIFTFPITFPGRAVVAAGFDCFCLVAQFGCLLGQTFTLRRRVVVLHLVSNTASSTATSTHHSIFHGVQHMSRNSTLR